MNIKFHVKLDKSGSEIREILVQVYGDNAMRKAAVKMCVTRMNVPLVHVSFAAIRLRTEYDSGEGWF
jgi:hypothetical protein